MRINLELVVKDCDHLSTEMQEKLHTILKKHEILFDGTFGKYMGEPYHIKLKHSVEPYHL